MMQDPAPEPAFPPEFARFGLSVRTAPQPGAVLLPELLGAAGITGLTDGYGATLHSHHRRAVLSMWSQHYFLVLMPAMIVAALQRAPLPDVAWETARVVLDSGCLPVTVCLGPGDGDDPDCPAQRLEPLLRKHLMPLARALAEAGLNEVVSWSNAAHVALWTLRTVRAPAERLARLSEMLHAAHWADGVENPLRRTMCTGARSVCCLRHRLPEMVRCTVCPALHAKRIKPGSVGR